MEKLNNKINNKALVGMDREALLTIVSENHQEKFRADQIFHWIYKQNIRSFNEMMNIPKELRHNIEKEYILNPLKIIKITGERSSYTQKYLLECTDGKKIESVLMREGKRNTICISSQVGCALGCKFCATGTMGIIRNLSVGEIVGQYLLLMSEAKQRITNIVFMGMGEPLLNYANVMKAAAILNDSDGVGIGARHITISTAGVVPGIKRFIKEKQRYKLAISLNGSDQEQRAKTMPIANKYKLIELLDIARQYYETTRNFITFEYVLMDGINNSVEDAKRIIDLLKDIPSKLNIIPYNETDGKFRRPGNNSIDAFLANFDDVSFTVTTRWSKGSDINAGCGQLAIK